MIEFGDRTIAYLVSGGASRDEVVVARARANLPTYARVALLPVGRLPLTAEGALDIEALLRIPVIDEATLARWESALAQVPCVEDVLVVGENVDTRQAPIHRWDLPRAPRAVHVVATTSTVAAVAGGQRPAVVHGAIPRIAPDEPGVLVAALVRAAATDQGIVHVEREGNERFQGYGALLEEARRIAAGLAQRGVARGQHVVLQLPTSDLLLPAFWGCLLGGHIVVPAETPAAYDPNLAATRKVLACSELSGRACLDHAGLRRVDEASARVRHPRPRFEIVDDRFDTADTAAAGRPTEHPSEGSTSRHLRRHADRATGAHLSRSFAAVRCSGSCP